MKKEYIRPEIETILLENEEVIAMSSGVPGANDPDNPGMNGVKRRSIFDE